MFVKDRSFVEGMRFADPVNIGHSVPALMDTLETRWMKRSVAKRNCVPTTKTAQETEYAKNTDALHHWNVSIPNNTVHLYELLYFILGNHQLSSFVFQHVAWQTSIANPVRFVSMGNVRLLVRRVILVD